jgi:methyltransferase OMS1, mitochondrial
LSRPGGRILLVEHSQSSVNCLARRQDRNVEKAFEKWGCRGNRNVANIAEAGLNMLSIERSHLGMLNRIEIGVGQ